MKDIVDQAYAGRYGVPAVPGFNEHLIRGAIEAAVEANSPLIILNVNRGDPEFTNGITKYFAEKADIPVALCLDHSRSFEDCVKGLRLGYTAIMADRSQQPYEENAAQVKLLAESAHGAGISIESELGHVGQGNNYSVDGVSALTDPEEAKRFLDDTGVDCLAVAVGTAHGTYSGIPKIDFGRLKAIDDLCKTPLVLHGGSGSGDENIHRACTMGVAKVNIVTDILAANYKAILDGDFTGNNGHKFYPALVMSTKAAVLRLFEITGSAGKAKAAKATGPIASDTASTEEK